MIPLSANPHSRFPQRPVTQAEGEWWVAKVKPRQEKALAFDLAEREIEYYLPMYTKITRRRDNNKRRKSVLCLFPGYLSYCVLRSHECEVFATGRIVNLVQVRNQREFVRQLEQIYHTLDLGIAVEPCREEDIELGTRVEVQSGPLRGICGTVQRVKSGHRLVLAVDVLGRAAVAVDAAVVKLLG